MAHWQEKDAKKRLGQLIEAARTNGPQIITLHGAERAVVLSIGDFRSLTAHKPTLKDYLLGGQKFDDFQIEPDRDTGREIAV